jgi:hypothetical protein
VLRVSVPVRWVPSLRLLMIQSANVCFLLGWGFAPGPSEHQ